jgi:hypothetical protein
MPATVTITGPVVALGGTCATMVVSFHVFAAVATPLKVTVLVVGVAPKPFPERVTSVPVGPEPGDKAFRIGGAVNVSALLGPPDAAVTTTGPVLVPVGTAVTMLVSDHDVIAAASPLNVTDPAIAPNDVPVNVTAVPGVPAVGDIAMMVGDGVTVNAIALLDAPPTVTTMLPVVAPVGTGITMVDALQLVGVADTPLNVTVLVP